MGLCQNRTTFFSNVLLACKAGAQDANTSGVSSLKTDLRFARPKIRGSTETAKRSPFHRPANFRAAKRRSVFRLGVSSEVV